MDYEALLKKYMAHVIDCEGFDFLELANSGGACDQEFTEEELEILEQISEEVCE